MEEREVLAQHQKNSKLYAATIELCKTCNWNCKYCYLSNHSDKGLHFEALADLLRQLREAGCFDVVFTGGEIFTRKDTMELIQYARRLGLAVNLMTNLSLLSHSMLDSLKAMNLNYSRHHERARIMTTNDETVRKARSQVPEAGVFHRKRAQYPLG